VTNNLGSVARPLRIAIIGAGPSGFYAAGALLQQKDVQVEIDMFDRLPAPFGLVRYGVAPDHQKIKSVTKLYERTASDDRFRFFGNVQYGENITHTDLRRHYDQIIYAVGAQSDRRLNVPGEDFEGSLSATEFVAWYNGHPNYTDLDVNLEIENVVVVGVGNVAMDVARILAKDVAELRETDIADYALEKLANSKINNIYVLARRGPGQVKFTNPEIREFGVLHGADVNVIASELELDPHSAAEIANDSIAQRNLEILREFAGRPANCKPKTVHFRFLVSPVEIIGDDQDRVAAVRIEKNQLRLNESGELNAYGTGEFETIPAGMVLRSVGYKGIALEDVPYDSRSGVIPNRQGRIYNPETNELLTGEYVVGWAKRGPSGVIGTNKPDAVESVEMALQDLSSLFPAPEPDPAAIPALLQERGVQYVDIEGWRILDRLETETGLDLNRPRVKFTSVDQMLEAIQAHQAVKA
jgi:ferredoxin/flavodoxin---NADP+ reductase